ncbi:MAG: hypothetical protein JXR82_01360 [Marinifilaceae bacterium]|nr:hypothetical protein [Marinifilaceae bacterium]
MWALILRALVGVGVIYAVKELFASDEVHVTNRSDCHSKFLEFNSTISISQEKKSNLISAHNTIRDKLTAYFSNFSDVPEIHFFIQGSYKMGTMVENMNRFSDVDLGIYFQGYPHIDIGIIQWHIKEALTGHTSREVEMRRYCVRLNYVRDFHIDLPVYYRDFYGNIYFGTKGNGWQKSDPKKFISWFKKNIENKPQLVRIIRYLKAWVDHQKQKTNRIYPSGLALTLWVIEYYVEDSRDDVAFVYTCDKILEYLDEYYHTDWKADMPVAPYDNVLSRLTDSQKENFYKEFKSMVKSSIEAVSSSDNFSAKYTWKQIFGYRFN